MMIRLDNYPDDFRLSQDECAAIARCCKGTIAAHRMAGLLPYIPGSPIKITVGDFKLYLSMMRNGVRDSLHRTLHISAADAPVYSRLDGMQNFTQEKPAVVIQQIVARTESLWLKYKTENKRKDKRAKKRERIKAGVAQRKAA